MVSLIGTYECKMDAKGRVMLPAAYKKQLADLVEEGFVVKRSVFQPCLEVYPMQEWRSVMAKLNKLNRFVKKNNDFIRRFTAGVKTVEMDSSGRFLIPKDLCQFASLKKEIVLSSGVTIFEVWDKGSYEKVLEDAVIDFADLAEEVMGNIDVDELS
ncbi:division/cell wall cluster transcriptional repressor MraZ [Tenacibaculum sp. SG-28]|uniref:division/cell wall cluster transcriptional repressor MraZ n=1 Tax=Tenacibaculum sp. SG-28 TaxID=754426 RepID=UPI000CF48FC3|nr:division/cell wall cluster transcriptional repressor MraZ [Tenacibaculum sp. SG-28]PQJ21124.1 division/cell wall cluster transcriptional repressor MraZ [Tenacibaculum sp. SG-28]